MTSPLPMKTLWCPQLQETCHWMATSTGYSNPIQDTVTCLRLLSPISHSGHGQSTPPAHPLHSITANWLATASLQGRPSYHSIKSWLLVVLAPQWWNKLPVDVRTAKTLHIFGSICSDWTLVHKKTKSKRKKTMWLSLIVSKCRIWSSSGICWRWCTCVMI